MRPAAYTAIGLLLAVVRVARASKHYPPRRASQPGWSTPGIQRIAICAGSGSSVLLPCEADLYLTGEMSHHEMLAATAKGTSCILAEHSNSERGFLRQCLQSRLQAELNSASSPNDPPLEVIVSQLDRDPVQIE
ncbi:hypothetical protein EV182_004233 [Spiromyces aspiralis]|uniref:Uncharacterized protein n=1 Tax=Spiromyces aspiralis TaxID=68401 RepID=A0ACC1HD99_9FUNG|nr:hypothetical protein EV182_004233 [Spiromyces aspiralis]